MCFVTFIGSIQEINISHGFCKIIFFGVVVNRLLAFALSHVGACVGDFTLN